MAPRLGSQTQDATTCALQQPPGRLSSKTVEHHLTTIYRALGVRSKAELASRYGRHAGDPPLPSFP
jgi:hypothetical protein